MKHACFLFLYGALSLFMPAAQNADSPKTALSSAKTCRITYTESYGEAQGIHLPALYFARKLFTYAGLTVIDEPDREADIEISLSVGGGALGDEYQYAGVKKGWRYSGAGVDGSITVTQSKSTVYQGKFEGEKRVKSAIGESEYKTKSQAPFVAAFYAYNEHSFFRELARTVGTLFGPEALMPALHDGNSILRGAAADMIGTLSWTPTAEQSAYINIARGASSECVQLGQAAVKPLIDAYSIEADEEDCFGDYHAKENSSDGHMEVSDRLMNGNERLKVEVIRALGKIGDPSAVDTILSAIKRRVPKELVPVSLEALASIKTDRAVDAIIEELKNRVGYQSEAAQCLGKIKANRAVNELIVIISGGDREEWEKADPFSPTQEAALKALAQIQDPRAVKPILALIKKKKEFEYENWDPATNALLEYKELAVKPLIDILGGKSAPPRLPMRLGAIYVLGRSNSRPAADLILGYLNEKNIEVVACSIEALGALKEKRAVAPLVRFSKGGNYELRWRAIDALGEIQDNEAVVPLLGILSRYPVGETSLDWQINRIWECTVGALGKIHDARALDPLLALAQEPNVVKSSYHLLVVMQALAQFEDKRIMNLYITALDDTRQTIRFCAMEGLFRYASDVPVEAIEPLLYNVNDSIWVKARELMKIIKEKHQSP